MDDHRAQSAEPLSPGNDGREPYEPPAIESLGGVYGQTQQTGPA
jgi:hypothetical protein